MCYILAIRERLHQTNRDFYKVRVSAFGKRDDPGWYPRQEHSVPIGIVPPEVLASIEIIPGQPDVHAITVSWFGTQGGGFFIELADRLWAWMMRSASSRRQDSWQEPPDRTGVDQLTDTMHHVQGYLATLATPGPAENLVQFKEGHIAEVDEATPGVLDRLSRLAKPRWFMAREEHLQQPAKSDQDRVWSVIAIKAIPDLLSDPDTAAALSECLGGTSLR